MSLNEQSASIVRERNAVRLHPYKLTMQERTALVLSGGGMFGSYQAGVWAALCGEIQPDIIVGASIGSLNGWLIAGGSSGAALADRWLDLASSSNVKWRLPKRISDGIIDPALADEWIQKIYSSCSPRVRYALVVTAMRTMKRVRFEWPGLSWQHLAASCAVPFFLRQQRIDGVLYGDGGLADPLPLLDAIEMGATRIVSVNVLKNRPLVVRAAAAAAKFYSGHRERPLGRVKVIEINPTEVLGTARDTVNWNPQNAERWISLGKQDANTMKHLVVECFQRV